jgi:hypothetical protein
MAYISTRTDPDPGSKTFQMYERALAGYGYLPNMVKAFSHRPEVMEAWNGLLASIKSGMDLRRYELVTMAAAMVTSSYRRKSMPDLMLPSSAFHASITSGRWLNALTMLGK